MRAFVSVPLSDTPSSVLSAIRAALKAEDIGFDGSHSTASQRRIGALSREIERSSLVIADVSAGNPNVLYELGYANALRKPTILIRSSLDASDLPSDLQRNFYLPYDPSQPEQLARDLRRLIRDQVEVAAEVA